MRRGMTPFVPSFLIKKQNKSLMGNTCCSAGELSRRPSLRAGCVKPVQPAVATSAPVSVVPGSLHAQGTFTSLESLAISAFKSQYETNSTTLKREKVDAARGSHMPSPPCVIPPVATQQDCSRFVVNSCSHSLSLSIASPAGSVRHSSAVSFCSVVTVFNEEPVAPPSTPTDPNCNAAEGDQRLLYDVAVALMELSFVEEERTESLAGQDSGDNEWCADYDDDEIAEDDADGCMDDPNPLICMDAAAPPPHPSWTCGLTPFETVGIEYTTRRRIVSD